MSLRINDVAPDFTAETTQGTIHFHEWIGNNWAVLFSHPKDFTPICTTELGSMAVLYDDFAKRGAKILAVSVDTVEDHKNWVKDIQDVCGSEVKYPIIADTELKVAKLYGMLPADAGDTSAGRTPALNATVRNVYIIGPDKKIKLILIYPMSAGRNFHEILRALDAIQMTTNHPVSTPANWNPGDDIVIGGSVSNEQAATQFPGFKTVKPYLRTAAAPK
jgi:alkyl hydroperoxide reductase subunit AhpC